jgi:hypothetical protein
MAIKPATIAMLWSMAAGRCSHPSCNEECFRFFESASPTPMGEMAHIIARRPSGPRGTCLGGEDTYDNLILLCPTHHTEIDKAPPGTFTPETLRQWKKSHEETIATSLASPRFDSFEDLRSYVGILLSESHAIWLAYSPDSEEAKSNPMSSARELWALRKLDSIIPNNRKIVNSIKANSHLFPIDSYATACAFMEHAEGLEHNASERREGVPKFPVGFAEVIFERT